MSWSEFQRGRLRVARELAGRSQLQLATDIGITPAAISQFESGAARPSQETIGALGQALDVPVEFFALRLSETHEGFFRSLRRTAIVDRRRARAFAHVAHDLAQEAARGHSFAASRVPAIPVSNLDAERSEIEQAAARVRAAWNVPVGPIADVVGLLEAHGVVVIRLPLGSADVDAFSLPFPDYPVVVLGTDKNDRARSRFDAAHELGHLVIHGEQIWGVKEVERQADKFAAELLMPAHEIYHQLPTTVDWPRLFELKRYWQVSLAALLMRARALDRFTDSTYLTAVKASSARGWRRVEPVPLGPPEQPRALPAFLASATGKGVHNRLPVRVVDAIAAAA